MSASLPAPEFEALAQLRAFAQSYRALPYAGEEKLGRWIERVMEPQEFDDLMVLFGVHRQEESAEVRPLYIYIYIYISLIKTVTVLARSDWLFAPHRFRTMSPLVYKSQVKANKWSLEVPELTI